MEDFQLPIKKLERKDARWAEVFESIQHPSVRVEVETNGCSKFQDTLTEVHWVFGLHYVFKLKWDSKHKIPVKLKPASQRAFKLWGEYLYAVLEMCVECHAATAAGVPYANAAEWFQKVALEMKTSDLKAIYFAKKGLKRKTVDQQRGLLKALKNYENPGDPKTHPHTFALVEAAITLAERSDVFRKKYWKPFTTAAAQLLENIEASSSWQTVFEKDGLPYVQAGRGNRILPYPGVKK
jgi:hypothetical protein